ncbi:MAG: lipid II flippase MurJ, partial [Pseudomonadota bacterium]
MIETTSLAGQIGRASLVVMIWSMVDKILAIGKEMLTAQRFGVSVALDVFNVAQAFPGFLVLFFSGVLLSAFVPLYLEWRNRCSSQEADSQATWLIFLTTAFFAVLALICFSLSPVIIQLTGYGFGPKEKQLGIMMERLLSLLVFIDGAGILFRGILQARKMFLHLYVAPIFVNITIIFLLYYDTGLDIYVLVWGFLIGTLLKTIYMGVAL